MTQKTITTYALYFAILFWIINTVLYIFGINKGMVAPSCMGISAFLTHLFYKKHERLPENNEQLKLAYKSIFNVLIYSWIPLLFIYLVVLTKEKQSVFISLFASKLLPMAFLSIGIVATIAFFSTWATIKFYSYMLKKDIERKG